MHEKTKVIFTDENHLELPFLNKSLLKKSNTDTKRDELIMLAMKVNNITNMITNLIVLLVLT
ncbi:hypothetical protein HMPREF0530_0892 [Lacticaseibacillus paracasei subsp. paracasei ATCC 25302 = DSM 5622 = JCM 8130]|nr:hypothetical protein HMPREF0530_0892 [Lacticaseibacillus paracasei subsp. paracasei ATCC 25302 = DSM 5622 = JCM 8130]